MEYTGDENRQEHHVILSIDKALDYIAQDIDNPDRAESVPDLIDVHELLTKLKINHIEKTKNDDSKDEDVFIYSYMVMNSLKIVFGAWDAHTKVVDGRVILHNDLVYMDINRDELPTQCIISFYYQMSPIIVAEVINTLKDIFGAGLKVSGEVFTVDEATGNYIWGMKDIHQHQKNISGNRIKPVVYFDDNTIGNS